MVRTQIQLSAQQLRRLRTRARQRGLSLAAMVRQLVDRGLAGESADRARLYERAGRAVGRFRDRRGARDLAREHDRYLDEALD